ncbi:hypothetical protein WJX74_009504 [Apatococcus lobatus]|uniref:Sucrose phosphatase-like domain-containing protein n=2 Tax=Apatococcus TaxID=904362 RepID=A0AAW1T690_9CHLO
MSAGSCHSSRLSRGSYRPLTLQSGAAKLSGCFNGGPTRQLARVLTHFGQFSVRKGFALSRPCTSTACKATYRQTQGSASQAAPTPTEQGLQPAPPAAPHHTNNSRWSGEQHSQGSGCTAGAVPQEESEYRTLSSGALSDLEASQRHLSNCVDLQSSSEDCLGIRLLYSTGWEEPVIHYSAQGADWETACLTRVTSSGGQLCETLIELRQPDTSGGRSSASTATSASTLEFVITDGFDHWDKPASGGNYSLTGCGTFVLQDGDVQAVPGRRCLVVSDLDDTLIGDDAGTQAFKDFWEQDAVVRGSRLVFNTGRALDSFCMLQAHKADCLPTPDLLIAAVGTKIYCCRAGKEWAEDADFAARLDEGWNLNVVREACYQAVMSVGREAMHFRPPEEQNDHKVTCGVLAAQATNVQNSIRLALDEHAVTAKLVFSGKGDWRYLDIVSQNAGKAEALNFVMEKLGFSQGNTIACGDSGNDKDMLAAANLAIVVGNAQPDLKQWMATLTQTETHHHGRLRLAQAKAYHAHGILEGLEQLGFVTA